MTAGAGRVGDADRGRFPSDRTVPYSVAIEMASALASEREREAIERAAQVAEQYREEAGGSDSYKTACKHIATAIRRLNTKEPK